RRHQADPAHRPHHAVPLLRRVLAGRELGDRRAPAAHLRPGATAAAGLHRSRRRRGRHPGGEDPMNQPIRRMAVACVVLFLALLLNATYLQFWQAADLNTRADNKRVRDAEFSRERGAILVNGRSIAESRPTDNEYEYQRVYPQPHKYAPITGYYSYIYGRSGIEQTQNEILSGSDSRLFVNRVIDMLGNQQPAGGSVSLTIRPAAQNAAWDGLAALGGDAKGAV